MPTEDEYGRRQVTQHASGNSPSAPSVSISCPAGCPAGALAPPTDRFPATSYGGSDKSLPDRTGAATSATSSFQPPDRFGPERSHSDRLPSGERYHGVSERYPLGGPQAAISSERLAQQDRLVQQDRLSQQDRAGFQAERHQTDRHHYPQQRYERYHNERYSRTNTPTADTTRHDLRYADKEYAGGGDFNASTQSICSDRYTPTERHRGNNEQYHSSSGNGSKTLPSEMYKYNKLSRYRYDHQYVLQGEEQRYQSAAPFPPIPCPERFASTQQNNNERPFGNHVPYMEPPSPAPASDRFIPPPPLSPANSPSPSEVYPATNPFPSPTNTVPPPERFIPPPPLSPSPTESYPSKSIDRYDCKQRYHQDRYPAGLNAAGYHQQQQRIYTNVGDDRLLKQSGYHHPAGAYNDTRYHHSHHIPPNAHMPVERYVPQQQQQDNYYYYTDRYPPAQSPSAKLAPNTDPYMRRDLNYHYRLPAPYPLNQYQLNKMRYMGTPNRVKCCQYQEGAAYQKSSPGSSSSSSITSQGTKDLMYSQESNIQQCQSYHQQNYQQQQQQQQEKGIQCNKEQLLKDNSQSPGLRKCRHGGGGICASPSVEYMGASGGRHVCATPPPRGSISSNEGLCSDQCCGRKGQTSSLTVAVWRAPPPSLPPSTSAASKPTSPSPQASSSQAASSEQLLPLDNEPQQVQQRVPTPKPSPTAVQRAASMPLPPPPAADRACTSRALNYAQSERSPRQRLLRTQSKKEMIRNYVRRETATFFGVCEKNECVQQERWLDRRKRLASRTYGALKDESEMPSRLRRVVSEVSRNTTALSHLQKERPDVLPGPSDVPDSQAHLDEDRRGKESVARMTWNGLSYVVTTLTRHQPKDRPAQWSRSYPSDVPQAAQLPASESSFFGRPHAAASPSLSPDTTDRRSPEEAPLRTNYFQPHLLSGWRRDPRTSSRGLEQTAPTVGGSRITTSVLDRVLDNSDRRQYGMGWVGKAFGRRVRKSVTQETHIRQQLDDMEDYRPMFTYWVSTVQVLIMLISIVCYGFGPFGLDLQARSGQVLVPSLSLQQVDYLEPANFWFGPRAADLIHLGAKFSPCMRIDNKIMQQIEKTRAKERETACCIRNDDSGCVQSSQADCSNTISTWKKWSAVESGPGGRISGSVCGLDPKFCEAPASVHPYEWPDDITKWPICRKSNTQSSIQKPGPRDRIAEHMVCEVIGHPCCIGIHGQCRITTREYCDFVRGTFHEEASLCSQVSCLNDVCGMIPFYFFEIPDQFYRLWTSLFLHAGILQLFVTLMIQYFLMRDLEKLTGTLRIGIIYIGSGVAGNLASAIFVPYRADVGPAGSQFGLLACLIVEVLNAWPMLRHPNKALCKLLTITVALFTIGLMPWVDNYAHLFGFVFGFLLSYALLPFISFGPYERQRKILLIWVCLLSASFLFICLVLLFYIFPVYDCKLCSYFNCLPVTQDFCASQNINFMREEPVV